MKRILKKKVESFLWCQNEVVRTWWNRKPKQSRFNLTTSTPLLYVQCVSAQNNNNKKEKTQKIEQGE